MESSKKSNVTSETDALAQPNVASTTSGNTNSQVADESGSKNNTSNSSPNTNAVSSPNENTSSTQPKAGDPSKQSVQVKSAPATSSDQGTVITEKSIDETEQNSRVEANVKNNEAVAETNKSKETQTASLDNSGSKPTKPSETSNDKNVNSPNTQKGENLNGNTKGDEPVATSAQKTDAGTKQPSSQSTKAGSDVAKNQAATPNSNSKAGESTAANNSGTVNGTVNSGTETTAANANVKRTHQTMLNLIQVQLNPKKETLRILMCYRLIRPLIRKALRLRNQILYHRWNKISQTLQLNLKIRLVIPVLQ
ncbi:MAG: hypothetical protein IPK08_02280 [Bacteroidetes bacterium]|nr:hypothetical protein [Bacteroidota bacterium]